MNGERAVVLAAVTGLTFAAACAGNPEADGAPDSEAAAAETAPPDTVAGVVRQVGSTPFVRTIVQPDEDGAVQVKGPYEKELTRLVGARVRAAGEYVEAEAMERALWVADYRVLSVEGQEPEVGLLRYREDGQYYLETASGQEVALRGVSGGLREKLGAKVWIVLGSEGAVQRYGIIREP